MAISKNDFIMRFSKAICEGNAAIFGGAGLSRSSGFVDWKELLRPIANEINLDIEKETDYLSVAQFYSNKMRNRGFINQMIIDRFALNTAINENILILTRLPIFTYWTTNYDELIERGIREANRNPDVKSESDQLADMKRDRDAIVYKMHGDVNRPANAVITKEDYELYEHNRPLFRTALRGDLVSKTFLFIGFSFEDPNLDYILSQIHSLLGANVHNHYCFFKKVQLEDCNNDLTEFGYRTAKQEMQEENLRNYGIQTVFVDSYDEITEILRIIEKQTKLKSVFISGSAEEFSDPWNKEKAEELAGKLAAALVHDNRRISSGFGLGIGSAVVNGALDVIYSEKYRHVDEHLCLRPFPQNISDPAERAKRWTQYRNDILDHTGISIFMFGNKKDPSTGSIVLANGCIEEFLIAKQKGNMIIPIGSTGFAAKKIFDEVKSNIEEYPYLSSYIDQLESETDIETIVFIVTKIINTQATIGG